MGAPEAPHSEGKERVRDSTMTILHWNVHFAAPVDSVLVYLLNLRDQGIRPDVLCFQELTTDSFYNPKVDVTQRIAEEFDLHYETGSESTIDRRRFSSVRYPARVSMGILSRHPILQSNSFELSSGGFDYLYRDRDIRRGCVMIDVELFGQTFTIATAHLSLPWFSETQRLRRKKEAEDLADSLDGKRNLVITGDFNSGINSYAVRRLEEIGLVRLNPQFRSAKILRKSTHTSGKILDHVFVTPDLESRVGRAELLPRGPSDHRPILLEIEI